MQNLINNLLSKKSPLKAKEIAKELGLERGDVNAFLYRNKIFYHVDSDYMWSLAGPDELVIELPNQKWIDCKSFEATLQVAGSPLDSKCPSVKFIIPKVKGILLEASARLLALCNQLAYAGKTVTIDFEKCPSTLTYLDRIGIFAHLDEKITVIPSRPVDARSLKYAGKSSALVEMGSIGHNKPNKEIAVQLTETFVKQAGSEYSTVAWTIFAELIGNVSEHSQTPIPGFAALQIYQSTKKHIQTIVSDNGLGIVKTLRPSLKSHYPYLYRLYEHQTPQSDIELITAVVTQGQISRFGGARGLGFKATTNQAMKFNASLSIRQENSCVEFQYKDGAISKIEKSLDLIRIDGTHICFDFDVN